METKKFIKLLLIIFGSIMGTVGLLVFLLYMFTGK